MIFASQSQIALFTAAEHEEYAMQVIAFAAAARSRCIVEQRAAQVARRELTRSHGAAEAEFAVVAAQSRAGAAAEDMDAAIAALDDLTTGHGYDLTEYAAAEISAARLAAGGAA